MNKKNNKFKRKITTKVLSVILAATMLVGNMPYNTVNANEFTDDISNDQTQVQIDDTEEISGTFLLPVTGEAEFGLDVSPADTIAAVKGRIQERLTYRLEIEAMILTFNGTVLDDNNTLESYEIEAGSSIVLDIKTSFEIFVKISNENRSILNVYADSTIASVKEKIFTATGIKVENQKLTFAGKELSDEYMLSYYSIQKDSTINLEDKSVVELSLDNAFSDGDGSQSNPYQISSLQELNNLATLVKNGEKCQYKYFKQTSDIEITGEYTPVG